MNKTKAIVTLLALLSVCLGSGGRALGANVHLKTDDQSGTTSWTGSSNWNNTAIPSAANDYFTSNRVFRTPPDATAFTNFAGNSLSLDPGGQMNCKHNGNFTNNNLILNGGVIHLGGSANGGYITNYGTIRLNGTTNSQVSTDTANRSIDIKSTIIGAGTAATFIISNIAGNINSNKPGVLLSGANTFSNQVLITGNSMVKANNAAAFGSTNGFTTIASGSMLDVNALNLGEERFTVAGAGTNNAGVIINSAGGQIQALRFVTLSGAATFGGTGRWDIRNPGAGARLVGAGFTLTKAGANEVSLVGLGDTDLGDIAINAGTLRFEGSSTVGRAANTITVASGASLDFWGATGPHAKNITLNGGRLIKNSGVTTINGSVNLTSSGGILEATTTSGTDLTVNSPIGGVGNLTLQGAGRIFLNGTNSLGGSTTIAGGKTVLGPNGSLYNSPFITVSSGAIFDVASVSGGYFVANNQVLQGSGVVTGAVTVSANGYVAPGALNAVGTITITNGNLSMVHQSSLAIDLSSASTTIDSGSNDLLVVNGNLSLTGTNNVVFSFSPTNGPLIGVPYTIIYYSGSLTGSAANLVTSGYQALFDTSVPGEVRVTFTGVQGGTSLVWKGDGALNRWDAGLSTNWLDGVNPSVFTWGDIANLDDTGSNNVPVTLVGPLLPQSVNVTANKDYTLAGSGNIMVGAVSKSGAGTLTISNANSYAGGTYVTGGTLKVGNVHAMGTNTTLVVVTNGGQIDLNAVDQSVKNFTYLASGAGPDGQGAIKNAGTALDLSGARSGIRNMVMVGDTTVGTIGNRFDIGGGGGLDGGGYTLTKVGSFHMPFRGTVSNLPVLNVNQGRFYSEQFSMQLTGVVNVAAGAMLGAYAYNTPGSITNTATVNLNGGHLGVESSQSAGQFAVWQGPVNVNAPSFLNSGQAGGNSDTLITGSLNGSADLTIANSAGTRAVILGTNNDATYSGKVTINSGNTLRLAGGDGSYGTGYLTNLGTLQFLRTNATTFSGNLQSSNGTVIHEAGSAQLTLAGSYAIGNLLAHSTNPLVIPSGSGHYVNYFGVSRDAANGTVRIDSGANLRVWSPSQGFWLGEQSGRSGFVTQDGGNVTVNGGMRIGHWGSESSLYTMNGGTLNLPTIPAASGETPGILTIGVDGTGTFRQTGGSVSVAGIQLDNRGDTGGFDTFALEGGTMTIGPWGIASANASQTNFIGGGTLVASASWASSLPLNLSGTNGNVTIDSGLNTITLSGNLAGPGGFNKTGLGTLVLSGNSLFTNFSSVNQGLVLANGQLGTNNSRIDVNAGGTLGGVGNVRPAVSVASGGTLTAGSNGLAGTLTITNHATLASGAGLLFDLANTTTTGGGVNDLIVVRTNLTLNASVPVTFNFLNGTPNIGGTYTIMQYGGALTGSASDLTHNSHYTATFGAAAGAVTVQFSGAAANLTWLGDGVGNLWEAGPTLNWTNGTAMDFFGSGDTVTFNDDGSNNVPVALSGTLTPASITVNATKDYNFAGSGRIAGSTGISKSGSGTLILTNAHDFTGSLVINGGAVVIGGDSSLGTAPVGYTPGKIVLNGGTLAAGSSPFINPTRGIALGPNPGTISVPAGSMISYGGIITNATTAGSLVKSGPGLLRLTSSNAYTGNTVISQGSVLLQNNLALGSNNIVTLGDGNTGSEDVSLLVDGTAALNLTNPIVVAASGSGTVRLGSTLGSASNPQFTSPLNINRDVTLVVSNSDRTTFNGPISGAGNITVVGNMRLALSATNTFTGNVSIQGNGTILQPFLPGAGTLARTIPDSATVDVGELAIFQLHGDEAIDGLTGTGFVQPIARDATLYLGANNGSSSFDGIIRNNTQTLILSKLGSGTFTLNGRSTQTGATVVNGGVLALGASGSISNSTQISVNSNGVFDASAAGGFVINSGKSIVGNLGSVKGNFTVGSNATLSVAGFAAPGTIGFSNNLTLDRGAVWNVNLTNVTTEGAGLNDLVNVAGDVVIGGTNGVVIYPLAPNLAVGTYRLLNYGGSLIGNPADLRVVNNAGGTRFTLTIDTSTAGQINLIVGASNLTGNLVWKGSVNGNWTTTATDLNWFNGTGADQFYNGDPVLFDDTGLIRSVVAATVLPGAITVSNVADYTISGTRIGGNVGITKYGPGTLTLSSTGSDFIGPIIINGGIVRAGATNIFGGTSSNAFGLATNIVVANGAQVDFNGVVQRQSAYRTKVTAQGFGPDGRGAVVYSAGGGHNATAQISDLTLAGDTGIFSGSGQVWDVFGGLLDGRGYKLYKYGPGRLDIFNAKTTNLAELVVAEGIVYAEGSYAGNYVHDNFGTNATVASGAMLALFGNTFANTKVTLNGGMLAGCGNALTNVVWAGPITLASNSTVGYWNIFNSSGAYYSNHIRIDGIMSGPGSLSMIGTPTNILYLNAAHTYTGDTIISTGRVLLLPGASIANSAKINIRGVAGLTNVFDVRALSDGFTLAAGQTLTGGGQAANAVGLVEGAVNDSSGAAVQPGGVAAFGTLHINHSLTNTGGGKIVFDLNLHSSEGGANNDLLVLTNLIVNGPTVIELNPLYGAFSNDVYNIIRYSGTFSDLGANLSVVANQRGAVAVLDTSIPNLIRVAVTNGTPLGLEWVGANATFSTGNPGDWDVNISDTWQDMATASDTTYFFSGDSVTFSDNFLDYLTVNVVGTVSPFGMTLNDDSSYTLVGSGSLGGSGLVTKTRGGTFTFANSGANAFAGPVDLQSGSIQIGNGGLAGDLPPGVIVTNDATLTFNRLDNITVPNTILGAGTLRQDGAGILTLSGNNAGYAGSVYVAAGVLKATASTAVGPTNVGSVPLTVAAGGTLDINAISFGAKPVIISGAGSNGAGALVNNGGQQQNAIQFLWLSNNATLGGPNRFDVRGAGTQVALGGYSLIKTGLSGLYFVSPVVTDGDLVVNQGIVAFEVGATCTNSPGSNGVITANGGTLAFGNWGTRLNVTRPIYMNGGIFQGESGATDVDVDSPITINTNTTFDIIVPTRLTNVISGPGRLSKTGGSLLVLAGPNTYTNSTVITAGTLQLGNGIVNGSVAGPIQNNATLTFSNAAPQTVAVNISGSGTINQAGAPLTLQGTNLAGTLNVQGRDFANTLILGAGSSNVVANVNVGQGVASGASGSMVLEPGSFLSAFNWMMGQQNTVTGQVVQLGGDVYVGGQYRLGHWPNNVSTHLMGGGSINITNIPASNPSTSGATEQNGCLYIGIDSVGVFTQTNGVINTPALVLDNRGTTTYAPFTNTYTLEGGTINIGQWGIQSGSGSAVTTYQVNLGGGTVGSLTNWSSVLRMFITGTNGDVTFNTGIFTNTLTGVLYGTGGLKKEGAGALVLNATNIYTGTTLVNAGLLGGNGVIAGPVVVASGGTIGAGTSIGTLTINNTLNLSGTTVAEISKLGTVITSDLIKGVTTLTYGGNLRVIALAQAPGFAAGDSFKLFDAAVYAGSFSSFDLPALPPGLYWDTAELAVDGTIKVQVPPSITDITPVLQNAECSSNVSFTVTASGTPPFYYRWFDPSSALIAWGTGATLNLSNVSLAAAGTYSVVVSNGVGNAATNAVLAVVDTTAPTITCPAPITVQCIGDVPAPNVGSVTATDGCDATPTVTHVSDVVVNGSPTLVTRTYRATDDSGNTNDCSQVITVIIGRPDPISYEPYAGYTNGSLVSQPYAGSGYLAGGSWTALVGDVSVSSSGGSAFASGGLSLKVTGGKATTAASGYNGAIADLNTNAAGPFAALVDEALVGGPNAAGTLYMSFLGRNASSSLDGTDDFAGVELYNGGMEVLGIGNNWGAWAYSTFAFGDSGDLTNSTGAFLSMDANVHLFVVRIDYAAAADDTVTVWMDPDLAASEGGQGNVYRRVMTGNAAFNQVAVRSGSSNNDNSWDFDEIRFGTNWDDVTPTLPAITAGPTSVVKECPDTNHTFTVTAAGTSPIGYQWYLGGAPLANETNASLLATAEGSYTVRVCNPFGSVTSAVATLTVQDTQWPALLACATNRTFILTNGCLIPTLPDMTSELVVTDACSSVTVTQMPLPGMTLPPGNTVVTLSAFDAAGHVTNCQVTVTLIANAPVVTGAKPLGARVDTAAVVDAARLLALDPHPDNRAQSVVAVTASTNGGTVTLNSGKITYLPPTNYYGTDAFYYTVQDCAGYTNATPGLVVVTISGNVLNPNLVSTTFEPIGGGTNIYTILGQGIPGLTYRLQRAEVLDITNTIWTDLMQTTAGSGGATNAGQIILMDTNDLPAVFYRTKYLPNP